MQIYSEFPAYFKAFALIAELRTLFETPPPAYHDALFDQPPRYDHEDAVARAYVETTGHAPAPTDKKETKKSRSLLLDPSLDITIDFDDTSRFRAHAKKKKTAAQKKAAKQPQNNTSSGGNDGAAGGDDGGGAENGGDAGGEGGGGDDGAGDKKEQEEEEERKRKEEEEEQKRKEEEEEEEQKRKEEEEAKTKAEEAAAANASLSWADEANNDNPDDWGGFTATTKKKKKKKGQVGGISPRCHAAPHTNSRTGSGSSAGRKSQCISGYRLERSRSPAGSFIWGK